MAFRCDVRARRFSGSSDKAYRTLRDRHRRVAHGSKKAIVAERKRVCAWQVRLRAAMAKAAAVP
eukprot:6191433-Alexandrium_andersonii.AAC.1